MKRFYYFLAAVFLTVNIQGQTTVNFSDSSSTTVTTSATVNDQIKIIYTDNDVINNFYTDNQTEIYLYAGVDTGSSFQYPVGNCSNTSSLTTVTRVSSSPNVYEITITPTVYFSDIPTGTTVNGINFRFRNQFNCSGNDVTPDFYIDLANAATYEFSGPGNVKSGLQMWLKADSGITTSGNEVTAWLDQSRSTTYSANKEGLPGYSGPEFVAESVNFNPCLRFDGSDYLSIDYLDANLSNLNLQPQNDKMTIFTVFKADDSNSQGTIISKARDEVRNYQVWLGQIDRVVHYTLGRDIPNSDYGHHWGDGTLDARYETKISRGVVNDGTYLGNPEHVITSYVNSIHDEFPAQANNNSSGNSGIGAGSDNLDILIGARRHLDNTDVAFLLNATDVSEIIIYNKALSEADIQKIESYLAIKYGVTLGYNDSEVYNGITNDYYDSDGNIIWNGTGNANYGYNIFGIARDDESGLLQTKSKSSNVQRIANPSDPANPTVLDAILTIESEAGGLNIDKSYLLVGHNGQDIDLQTTSLPVRTINATERIWAARESANETGSVKLSFDLNQYIATSITSPEELELYIADNESFDNYENFKGTYAGGIITFSGIDLNEGDFFKLATPTKIKTTNSLSFDGVDDYVEGKSMLDGATTYTIMGWARNPGQSNTNVRKHMFGIDDKVEFLIDDDANSAGIILKGEDPASGIVTNPATNRTWNHYAITVSHATNTVLYYYNGNQVGGSFTLPSSPAANNNSFRMASFNNLNYFEGFLDEIRVFNYALTADQIQRMVYQEIEQNGTNVRGTIIPKDITDETTNNAITWSSLTAYYKMSEITGNRIEDESENNNYLFIKGASLTPQTAPMPYETTTDGNWEDSATWSNGSLVDIPSSGNINWAIIKVHDNVTMNNNYTQLGLFVDNTKILTAAGTNPTVTNLDPFTVSTGAGYRVLNTWYLELHGTLDLEGESQLQQTESSTLAVTSSGKIEKDQQGTANTYTYNYWSSPVSAINSTANNQDFTVASVLMDGTDINNPQPITWTSASQEGSTSSTPITLSNLWMYQFVNGADEDYNAWQYIGSNSAISPGEGFTMKGSGTSAIKEEQNYVFIGKPNNGTITVSPLDDTHLYLVGNPYPSAIDANDFINQNLANNATSGTLYFWEHWGNGLNHNLEDYEGGYGTYTLAGGVPAISHPSVSQDGQATKTPKRFIPVGQGFYVQGDSDASNGTTATVTFNNSQRRFTPEFFDVGGSQLELSTFMRNGNSDQSTNSESAMTAQTDENDNGIILPEEDTRTKIRIGYTTPTGFHRQLLLTFDAATSDAVDAGYDGLIADLSTDDSYWMIENDKYVVQSVNEFTTEKEVDLGINSESGGSAIFTIDELINFNEDVDIYLKDKYTGETFDLKQTDQTVFINSGETNDRYAIVFQETQTLSTETPILEDQLIVYMNQNTNDVVIKNTSTIALTGIEIHSIVGQKITTLKKGLERDFIKIPMQTSATGVYLVTVYSEQGKATKKIVKK